MNKFTQFLTLKGLQPVTVYGYTKNAERILKQIGNLKPINFGLNTLLVEQGKGFKDGFIHLPSRCSQIIMQYITDYKISGDEWLFKTYQGNKYNSQALNKFVKTLAKKSDIQKRVYPYIFRHSLATNMIKRGSDILAIKEHFRHAWIETTMLYINSICQQERAEQHFPQYI